MTITINQIHDALRKVPGPDGTGNIVENGLVSEILVRDGRVAFAVSVPADLAAGLEPLRRAAEAAVVELAGVEAATVVLTADATSSNGAPPTTAPPNLRGTSPGGGQSASDGVEGLPGVGHIIAVASGKGGVGKSTTAVNLALGLQALGLRVGIFDADIYGPSLPRLIGLSGQMPHATADEKKLIPLAAYGLAVMSMGFLVDEDLPVIWRGPMVVQALQQMLFDVAWDHEGPLDVLVIDMPPGTGDVQLTLAQQVPLSGAVIVSTPQDLALIDARKGLNMFRKVDVPVLGLVENMSYFIAPDTGTRWDIFGHGGAEREAERLGLVFLGGVPLHMDIRELSDAGTPVTAIRPQSAEAAIYRELAARVWGEVLAARGMEAPVMKLSPARDTLRVSFKDGFSYDLPAEMLRVMSPSAEVQGHSPSEAKLVAGKRGVKIMELKPVGKYAARIVFDDGHETGLYPWSYLADLGRDRDHLWASYEADLAARGLSRDPA
jgi:ATP-binding protein involved in chromosome partitioning